MRIEPLDAGLTAVFHRSSGITHLLAEPAPEIVAALGRDWIGAADLLARLADRFDLVEADGAMLRARLDELVAAGLVEVGLVEAGVT